MEPVKPYVGVTGFNTKEEVEQTGRIFKKIFPEDLTMMFGFCLSSRRIEESNEKGFSVAAKNIVELASHTPESAIPMIHYSTKSAGFADEVKRIFGAGKMYEKGICRAIQFNAAWPDLGQMERLAREYPELKMVLQLPQRAMEGKSIEEIADWSREYDHLAAYALIDPSGGKGREFDLHFCSNLMIELYYAMPSTLIGVAGGFSGKNVRKRIEKIKKKFANPFFIDAYWRLREKQGGRSAISIPKMTAYLEEAVEGMTSNPPYC